MPEIVGVTFASSIPGADAPDNLLAMMGLAVRRWL